MPPSAEGCLGLEPHFAPVKPSELKAAPRNTFGSPHVASITIESSTIDQISGLARQHSTTFHGALAAALVFALREKVSRFDGMPVRFISPVSTRGILGVHEECGLYFTSPQSAIDPALESFWEIATAIRRDVVRAADRDALLAATEGMRKLVGYGLDTAGAAEMLQHEFAEDVLLSNLGRIPFDIKFGNLRLLALWGPAALAGLPDIQTIGAITLSGKLHLLHTSYEPITALLETVREILIDVSTSD